MITTCTATTSSPKMTRRSLLAWNGPVKSDSGVMVKSCHVLPNSAAMGERLATYSVPSIAEGEHALALPGMRAERHGRQRVVERADVAKLDAALLGGRGVGQVGGRDHPALVIEDVAQGAGAYLALGEVGAKTAERDVGRRDAGQLAVGIERRGDGDADQGLRGKDVGIGDDGRARLFGGAIPRPHARIVGRVVLGAAQFLLLGVEENIVIEGRRSRPSARSSDRRTWRPAAAACRGSPSTDRSAASAARSRRSGRHRR